MSHSSTKDRHKDTESIAGSSSMEESKFTSNTLQHCSVFHFCQSVWSGLCTALPL